MDIRQYLHVPLNELIINSTKLYFIKFDKFLIKVIIIYNSKLWIKINKDCWLSFHFKY